jgi:hypothetical protein
VVITRRAARQRSMIWAMLASSSSAGTTMSRRRPGELGPLAAAASANGRSVVRSALVLLSFVLL